MNTVRKFLNSNPENLSAVKQRLGRAYKAIKDFQNDRDNSRKRDAMVAAIAETVEVLRVIKDCIPQYKQNYFDIVENHATLGMDARDLVMAFDRMVYELHTRLEQTITSGADFQAWSPLMLKILDERRHVSKHKPAACCKKVVASGYGVTPGCLTGPAAKVLSMKDLRDIAQGSILLTRMTTPDFVLAVGRIAGLATEQGGQFCHAAVLAREFNIPCVVGCGPFMDAVQNNDPLQLDADNGTLLKIF